MCMMSNKSNQRVRFLLIFLSFSSAVSRGFSLGQGHVTDHDNFGEPQPPCGMAVSEGGLVFFGCRRFLSHRVWWPRFRLNEGFPFMFGGIRHGRCYEFLGVLIGDNFHSL